MVKEIFYGTPAYDTYVKGLRYNRIGHGLLWPGVYLAAGGLAVTIISSQMRDESGFFAGYFMVMGIATTALGIPFIATGITLRVKSKRMVARAVSMYNDHVNSYGDNYLPKISLGVTPGGLGVAYTF